MARPTMFHHVSCPVFLLAVVVVVVVVLVWWNPVSEGFTIPHGFKNCRVFARNSDGVVGIPVAKVVMLSSSSSNEAEPGAKEEKNQDDSNAKTIDKLKKDLTSLAARTLRGFEATSKDRKAARAMIDELARFNPTREPAAAYYKNDYGRASTSTASSTPTLAGKWTLIYTDAPDITSLQQSITAELGRIGQECEPPYIRNVIEWKKPSWAANLPWSGTEKSSQESSARIIQKVVTEGSATPDRPTTVNLAVAGLSFESVSDDKNSDTTNSKSLQEEIERQGLLPALLKRSPINLQGPWRPPFGKFEILYLDDEFRMIRTGQGFVAVNRRNSAPVDDWF